MTKKTLKFDAKNPFPVALNTYDDEAQLLMNEVQKNYNVLRMPNGELITHPRWDVIDAREIIDREDCNRIIVDFLVNTIYIETQLLIFGHYGMAPSDGGYSDQIGFVGRIIEDNIDGDNAQIEMLIDNLNPFIVPSFVPYMKGVYITLGAQGIYYYDGSLTVINKSTEGGGGLNGVYPNVGATLRGRMWLAGLIGDPGKVKFTEIGLEDINSSLSCGDNGEIVSGLIPNDESMVITKVKEIYEYFWSDDITKGTLHTHTLKAGCVTHTLLQKHFEKIYMMGGDAAYIKSPKPVRAMGREVIVDAGITEISRSIKNLINEFKIPAFNEKVFTQTDFTTYLWKQNVTLPYGGDPRIAKSAKTIRVESFTPDASYSCKKNYVYNQGIKLDLDSICTDIYLKLAKSHVASGTEIRLTLSEDDGGAPGDIIATKIIDTSSWGTGTGWYVFQLELWGGGPYILRKYTDYWIKFENLSAEVEYTWYLRKNTSKFPSYTDDPSFPWSTWEFAYLVYGEHYLKDTESWIISNVVELSGIDHWQSFNAGSTTPSGTNIEYYIRAFDQYDPGDIPENPWQAINPGAPIPDDLKFATQLQWKAVLSSTDFTKTPSLNTIFFYGICYKETELIGSGFRNNRYYIFAKDAGDNDVTIIFSENGWLQTSLDVDIDLLATCHRCHEDTEINDIKIVGCGEDLNTTYGCLFKALDYSDEKYRDMPIEIKTGKILLDEIPKKGRKIFITYQGETVVLKIYAEDGTHTFNLANAISGFNIEEINFRTERTKWTEFEISASKKFKLKELALDMKLFKANKK